MRVQFRVEGLGSLLPEVGGLDSQLLRGTRLSTSDVSTTTMLLVLGARSTRRGSGNKFRSDAFWVWGL